MRQPMDLSRRAPHRATKKSIMVVYADDAVGTYLHWMKKVLDHSEIPLVQTSNRQSAVEMVKHARKLKMDAVKAGNSYAEVWCVLTDQVDRDAGIELATKGSIEVVTVHPAFVLWLLLHFEEAAVDGDHEARLAYHLPDLESSRAVLTLGPIASKYDDARRRARELDASVGRCDVFRLIDSVRDSLRAYRGLRDLPPL